MLLEKSGRIRPERMKRWSNCFQCPVVNVTGNGSKNLMLYRTILLRNLGC